MSDKSELKEQFIELRIEGKTFKEIAIDLEVSKQTLINWSKEDGIKELIRFGQLGRLQTIIKENHLDRDSKIERFAGLAQKINAELDKRDFKDVPTDKLLKIAIMNEQRIKDALPVHTFITKGGFLIDDDLDQTFQYNPED